MLAWVQKIFGSFSAPDLPLEQLVNLDERIVIGKILDIRPHSDMAVTRVRVTTCDVDNRQLQILCGANNIAPQQLVAVATEGATLPGGMIITQRDIRGEASAGMICSREEIGLPPDNEDGIWILPSKAGSFLGQPLSVFAKS